MGAAKKLNLVVDFEAVLAEIRASGQSYAQISDATGISKSTLVGIGGGYGHPLHANGEKLIAHWSARTRKPREMVPMTQEF